ncbi:MAG: peptidylprolyl isomerase [Paracoccaceae bacterium]|nr:peptidylprolyl isomerase [Paracoccaceae bacterium]
MTIIVRVLNEPLVHFLAIGVAIFLIYAALNGPGPDTASGKTVDVTAADVNQMAAQFESTWRRAPTREEMDKLIDAHVRDSILVQEAILLSMDKGDAIIERRLSQKMAFLMESAAVAMTPAEEVLKAFFEENKLSYATAPQIAFEQVYFGEAPEQSELYKGLAALLRGANPTSVGRRTLLPPSVVPSSETTIDGAFGRGFFDALMKMEVGDWVAPVRSGFGVHALRITRRDPGVIPEFDAVRDRVVAEFTASRAKMLSEAMYMEFREGYDVTLPEASEIESVLQ